MNNTTSAVYFNKIPSKGISWKAILAGTVITLSVMLILNLIGLAIGLWSIEPTEADNPMSGIGTGAVIWWVISNLIVLFIGGYVAARVGVSFHGTIGVIQGIMTWAMYALISAWLVTTVIGSIISGVGNAVGGVLSTTGEIIQKQLSPVISEQFEDIEFSLIDAKEEFYALLEDTGKEELDPQRLESKAERSAKDARREITSSRNKPIRADANVDRIFSKSKNRFEQSFEAIDKQALVNILVERTDMNESEASRAVDNILAEFESAGQEFNAFMKQTQEKAEEKAEDVADSVAAASMYLAAALILGLIASSLGGYLGISHLRENYIKNNYTQDDDHSGYSDGLS